MTNTLKKQTVKVLIKRDLSWGSFLVLKEFNDFVYQGVCDNTINSNIGINDLIEITGSWEPVNRLTSPLLDVTTREFKISNIDIINKGNNLVEDQVLNKDLIFNTMSKFTQNFASYFNSNNGCQIFTPKLIEGSSEGGAEVFKVDYFGETRYLAQSPQLYKQIMVNLLHKPVFEISNVFRAENSKTSRHLHEFTSLDAEFPLRALDVNEVMYHCLEVLKGMFPIISIRATPKDFSITLRDALKVVNGNASATDLTAQQELDLYLKLNQEFIFVTNYPNEARAFYTYEDQSFDVLYKGVEIISGAVRKFKYDDYINIMEAKGINPDDFKQYLDVFKQGAMYHGGFGIGLNRVVRQHLDLESVKNTII